MITSVLDKMKKVIASPRKELSSFAPRVFILQINPDKIGMVIGSGGSVIKQITEDFDVEVDIEDTGRVFITAKEASKAKKALEYIENIVKDIEIGDTFNGKVIKNFRFWGNN